MKVKMPPWAKILFEAFRYIVIYGGRGGGKSWCVAIVLLIIGMERKIRVLCARELQISMADSVHKLLSDIINYNDGMSAFYEVTNKTIKGKNGTEFSFKGLKHNANEIKSYEGVDFCWVEEAQAVSDNSWEILIPTIRKEGSQFIIIFNPKNATDPTWQRFVLNADDDMIVREVNYYDNPFFPDVLEKERVKLKKSDKEAYDHVWLGKFDTRYSGAVYAKYVNQNQVSDAVQYDPQLPIDTYWDLGFDDATAITFAQNAPGEVRVIDYYETNFEDVKHYCEVLYGAEIIVDIREPATGKVLKWHFDERMNDTRAGYNYLGGKHYVPHDAANKLLAAGGRSIVDQFAEFGIQVVVIPSCTQQDSEAALRKTLPMMWFGRAAADLVQCLLSYHYEYDDDRKIYGKAPVHDWSSHGCDSAELLGRMWRNSGLGMHAIAIKHQDAAFTRLRSQHKLDEIDPYRTRVKK